MQSLNAYMRSNALLEQFRPLRQYASDPIAGFAGGAIIGIAKYGGRLVVRVTGLLLVESGAGTGVFASVTTPFSAAAPDASKYFRGFEANNNFYFPCATGTMKFDSVSTNPYRAGIVRALDPQLTLVAAGTLLANTQSAAYRVVFGLLDANRNLILGPPSGRVVTTATAAQNVTVKAFIPTTVYSAANGTSYFVQIYRTPVQTIAGTDPGEDMQLVYQALLTGTDISNKFISFTDATPDGLRGAAGYFTPSQDGIAQSNNPPPIANDTALFQGSALYANTKQKHTAQVQLNGVSANLLTISTAAGGITKSGGNGVYTFTGSPDLTNIPTDGTAKLSSTGNTSAGNNGEFVITAVNTGAFTITVTNAGAVTEPGLAGSRAWPSKLTIAGVNYYGSINGTETAGTQTFKVATAGTASQNVTDTCASLLRVVNQQAVPVVYGFYESGPDDGAGKMSFAEVAIGGSSFTVAASGTLLYGSFNPTIPAATPLASSNDAAPNRVYISKQNQPEHVPLASYFDIGSRSKNILRIVPLRQAVLVFKEDGLFRISGDSAGSFSVSPFDPYLILVGANAVVTTNNRAYALTRSGFAEITESASAVVSEQVADIFREYVEVGVDTATACAMDVDRVVGVRLSISTGILPDRCLAYCLSTRTWSEVPTSDGISDYVGRGVPLDGRIYAPITGGLSVGLGVSDVFVPLDSGVTVSGTAKRPLPGHKVALNVTAQTTTTGGNTITYDNTSSYAQAVVGSLILGGTQTPGVGVVTAVGIAGGSTTITLAASLGSLNLPKSSGVVPNGYVYLIVPQSVTVEWIPFSAGDDAAYVRFSEAAVVLDGASTATTCTANLYTEATVSTQTVNMTPANTPLPSGINTQTLVRSIVPSNMQHARRLSVVFNHSTAGEYLFIRGVSYEFERIDGNEIT